MALVLPAFETKEYSLKMPNDKVDLLALWQQGLVQPFRSDVWPQGHGPTDYERWKTSVGAYSVQWAEGGRDVMYLAFAHK